MKPNPRSFLSDLKAAVRIGHPQSVELALGNLRAWPYVAANDQLPAGFIKQVIHPAARMLARRPAVELSPWLDSPLAAYRSLAAASLAYRFLGTGDVDTRILHRAAKDAREEVRLVLGGALSDLDLDQPVPPALPELAGSWLVDDAPKVRAVALNFIPPLAAAYQTQIPAWLLPLGSDPNDGVIFALAKALKDLAESGFSDIVLALLDDWVSAPRLNVWLIARSISGSWAASYPQEARAILLTLQSKTKRTKEISNALKALQRHG
ncbi:MAG: hypothetical protein ABFS03_11945, partial [Chloroflexota bacterium]